MRSSGGEEQWFHSHQQLEHAIREREHFSLIDINLGKEILLGSTFYSRQYGHFISIIIGISNVIRKEREREREREREAAWLGVWGFYLVFSWLVTVAIRAVCCTRDLPHSFTVQHTLSVAQLC